MKNYLILILIIISTSLFCDQKSDWENVHDEAMLRSVLWHQTAAEYSALCYQAYHIASDIIIDKIEKDYVKKPAIILDIDETVVNNSYYNAREALKGQDYPDDFYSYIEEATGTAIAGAYDFLHLADSLGYEIFYITNRRERGREGTEENLRNLGYPQVCSEKVLMKSKNSSKQPRRDIIAKDYEIVLLIGDNLIDFADFFECNSIEERNDRVEEYRDLFGDRFIILPNVMHGAWAKALYDFDKTLTEDEQKQSMLEKVRTGNENQ